MTHATCPSCRLRYSRVAASTTTTCPFCSGPLTIGAARDAIGHRLIETSVFVDDTLDAPALPIPLRPRAGGDDGT
jgi:hypothetical protein